MRLSEENRALIERDLGETVRAKHENDMVSMCVSDLNRLLDAARAEGAPAAEGKEDLRRAVSHLIGIVDFTVDRARVLAGTGDGEWLPEDLALAICDLADAYNNTPAPAAEPVASELRPRFTIGQPVEVPDTCQYFADWRGQTLWIAGVQFDHRKRRLDYTVSEHWPPRHNGDLSDGWADNDLTGARAPAVPGGEHG